MSAARVLRALARCPDPNLIPNLYSQASVFWSLALGTVGTFTDVEWRSIFEQMTVDDPEVMMPVPMADAESSPRSLWLSWITGVVGPALGAGTILVCCLVNLFTSFLRLLYARVLV